MRVIAGDAKGRKLLSPRSRDVRPTSDRVREAIFDVLSHLGVIEDATVVDLYAGTGALGIEALSRGAKAATFVDNDQAALEVIEENLARTGFADDAKLVRADRDLLVPTRWPRRPRLCRPAVRLRRLGGVVDGAFRRSCGFGGKGGRGDPFALVTPPSLPSRRYARHRGREVSSRAARGTRGGPVTTALFPGSFDPFHNGHLEVVERAHRLFDEVVVAVLRNSGKPVPLLSVEARVESVAECVEGFENVRVISMQTLAVDVARKVGATVIVKGLRAVSDFENELQMAQMNQQISGIETVMLPTGSTYSFIASRLVREIARYGGDVSAFVPDPVLRRMKEALGG